jgi:GNAT superfamily N-acetyltransferase
MSDNLNIVLEVYTPEKTYYKQKNFNCGKKVINKYVSDSLKKHVRDNLSRCFVLLDANDSDRFIGFYTLTSFAIEAHLLSSMSKGRLPAKVPCTRMVMLGVDLSFQKKGLGLKLLVNAIDRTLSASAHIGVMGLYLDADPDAYNFYKSHGFVPLKDRQDPDPTPMFLHIEVAKDSIK